MRVLIVDDNADIRFLIDRVLGSSGFETETAASGADAIEVVRAGVRPDVIVLDVQMPEMDGWEALAAIRAIPGAEDIAVVMCTVKGRPPDEELTARSDCDAYVTKPFDIDKLIASVNEAVERRRTRSEV